MTRVGSSEKLHRRPSTSNTNVPNGPIESQMNAPIRSTPKVGSVRIFPPTLEQVSLRINIDSQSRLLRILPDTPENNEIRQEMTKQIQLWERALLETAGATSDEQVKFPRDIIHSCSCEVHIICQQYRFQLLLLLNALWILKFYLSLLTCIVRDMFQVMIVLSFVFY